MNSLKPFLLVLFLSAIHYAQSKTPVFAIDLGSQFMKIAIVKPGVPMDIALNRESDRKTPVAVSIRKGARGVERSFGEPALQLSVRQPRLVYQDFTPLVGKLCCDHPHIRAFLRKHPQYRIRPHPVTGHVQFIHDDDTFYTAEELLAMVLQDARNIVNGYAGVEFNDVAITVPPYLTQMERRAILRAATNLTGLNVFELMNSNTAVGLNFGVFRYDRWNASKQYYLLFDMGASDTVATVVSFETVKNSDNGYSETVPQMTVLGLGVDTTLGANAFVERLRSHMVRVFNGQKKSKLDIGKEPKALRKLWVAAESTLQVLSANNEDLLHVESLVDDKDYSAKVSRADLEQLCADLFDRLAQPLRTALRAAHFESFDVINEVVLMGGGSRIPKVQETLLKITNKKELGKSLNTDEAGALGAVYQAAALSKAYRVKRFLVREAVPYPIQVGFERGASASASANTGSVTTESRDAPAAAPDADSPALKEKEVGQKKWVNRVLYGSMNPYPMKKVLTFAKHTSDFEFYVNYGDIQLLSDLDRGQVSVSNLSRVRVSGVSDAVARMKAESSDARWLGIKAHMDVNSHGVFTVLSVDASYERPPPPQESTFAKLSNAFSSLFSSGEANQTATNTSATAEQTSNNNTTDANSSTNTTSATNETASSNTNTTAGGTNASAPVDTKPQLVQVQLPFTVELLDGKEPTEELVQTSIKMLEELRAQDEARLALDKSRNDLEAYLVSVSEKFETEAFKKCSTPDERQKIEDKHSKLRNWYEDEASVDTNKEEYDAKRKEMQKALTDVDQRVRELELRPKAIANLTSMINHTMHFLALIKKNFTGTGEQYIFTEADTASFERLLNESIAFLLEKNSAIKSMNLAEKPTVTAGEINSRVSVLEREVDYFLMRVKRWRPPVPKKNPVNTTGANATASENATSTNETESSTGEKPTTSSGEGEENFEGEGIKLEFPPRDEDNSARTKSKDDEDDIEESAEDPLQLGVPSEKAKKKVEL